MSSLNVFALKILKEGVVTYLCVFLDGMANFRTVYTRLWSLIPICMTPEDIILEGSLVKITSISVLEVEVTRVGSFISCVS